jgi:hypothetical protein
VDGTNVVRLPPTKDPTIVVNWKVMVDKAGSYPLRLQSSTGLTLKKTISIEARDENGGTFVLKHFGEIGPGKEFTLRAHVTHPVVGQKLTLKLPSGGMALVDGPAVQEVRPLAGEKKDSVSLVSWRIRVTDKEGTLPVRVVSTTGMARTMTIVLTVDLQVDDPTLFGGKLGKGN